jgi:hypothetical protein
MLSFKTYFHIFLLFTSFSISYAQNNNSFKPEEITEKELNKFDEDLSLDDFQKFELQEFILDKTTQVKNAMDTGIDDGELRFLIENNTREIDFKLKEVLSTEQYNKYIQLKRDRAINQNQKKKRKKKSSN